MKKTIEPLKILVVLGFVSTFFSCNSDTKEKEDTTVAKADTTTSVQTKVEPVFTPFDIVEINHSVKDYTKWKAAFDADSAARKASGLEFIVIGRGMDKPNSLSIAFEASDVQKAKTFVADPRLKEIMEKNGVISKPGINYYHVIRFNPDSKEKQWVLITHKVKDFDTWLKVFDNEGTVSRAGKGLIDVVLARGIDDPNIVQIVFDINDLAKAKARINDPALKKLMTDAGVIGAPKIEFYTTAD